MRRPLVSVLGLISIILVFAINAHPAEIILNNAPTQVYFSPNGGCTEAIVKEISAAKREILVQAYSFTSAPIAKALVEAHKRGVRVEAILDKSQRTEKYSSATFLANSRIPTFIDARHAIAHNKIMIIDHDTVITGSFNFTKAAEEKNAENLLIIKSKLLAKIYMENWNKHREHSDAYEARY
jgi:phosphatidylserine/phosphatidylglycerophosphate/cardiolipin synthase-like enzyme